MQPILYEHRFPVSSASLSGYLYWKLNYIKLSDSFVNIVHALPTTYRSTEFFFKVMCCNISTLTIIVYYNLHMYQSWIKFLRYILQMEKIRSRTVIIWTNDWQDGLLYSQNITAWFAIRSSLNPHKTVRAYKQFKTRVPFCTHFLKQIWYEISHCYIYYIYVVKIAVLKVTMNSFVRVSQCVFCYLSRP